MKRLEFDTTEEFEQLFKRKTRTVTDLIVGGIEEAMANNKRTAPLFEITISQAETAYEISLPRSQWQTALESCLEFYHAQELADEAIDCWKLLEAAKVW